MILKERIYHDQLEGGVERALSHTVLLPLQHMKVGLRGLSHRLLLHLRHMAQRRPTVALCTLRYFTNSMFNNETKDDSK